MTERDVDPLLAAMRRIAAEESERDEAQQAELADLLRPIDAPRQALVLAAARAALRGEEASPGGAPPAVSASPAAVSAAPAASSSNVVPLRARVLTTSGLDGTTSGPGPGRAARATRWAAIGSAIAIAAGVALFVSTRTPVIELPAYEASLVGGVRDVRADDAPRTFPSGKPLRVRLRPEHAVLAPVGVVVALRRGDRVTRVAAALEALEGGALSVQLTLPAVEPGPAELLVLVGEPRALPSGARAEDLVDAPGRRLVRLPLMIGSP